MKPIILTRKERDMILRGLLMYHSTMKTQDFFNLHNRLTSSGFSDNETDMQVIVSPKEEFNGNSKKN